MSSEVNSKNKLVAIIGCGSVGASLAYKLLKSGITNFILIDPETLSPDNIGRHLLGFEYVSQNKAFATKNCLEKQFLDCNIEAINGYAEQHTHKLVNADIIITALGSDAPIAEEFILSKSIKNEIPDTIAVWLEANAYVGHAVHVNRISYTSINDISKKLAILKSEYSTNLEKVDVGCNSTYMPYTFIDADQHINNYAKMVVGFLLKKSLKPIITSIGNISEISTSNLIRQNYQDNTIIKVSTLEEISV